MPKNVSDAGTYSAHPNPFLISRRKDIFFALILGLAALLSPTQSSAQDNEEANKTLVQNFFERVLNAGDTGPLSEMMSESYIQHNPFVPSGREGFKEGLSDFRSAFPDYRL